MVDPSLPIEIPHRALFRAAEVCDLVKLRPYVLRSWETEFPGLGVAGSAGSARVYRREDVEQVIRIKHLLLVDGLTLAGARRKLEEEATPVVADDRLDDLIGQNVRDRLTEIRRGLRSILDLLSGRGDAEEYVPHAPLLAESPPARSAEPEPDDHTRDQGARPQKRRAAGRGPSRSKRSP